MPEVAIKPEQETVKSQPEARVELVEEPAVAESSNLDPQAIKRADKEELQKVRMGILQAYKKGKSREVYSDVLRQTREMENREPTDLNFEIIEEKRQDGMQLSIRTKDGREISLNEYLPVGYQFKRDYYDYADAFKRRIGYRNIKNPSAAIITSFHELGHANSFSDSYPNYLIARTKVEILSLYDKLREKFNGNQSAPKDRVPINLSYQIDRRAESERDAWAYALKELRKLQRAGVDVFGGFKDGQEAREYIESALSGYEKVKLDEIRTFFSKEEFDEYIQSDSFKPSFVKR